MSLVSPRPSGALRLFFALSLSLAGSAFGQTVTMSLNRQVTLSGTASSSLQILLASTVGSEPAAVQFKFTYPTTYSNVTVNPASSAANAGKTVVCQNASGSATCIVSGIGTNVMSNGPLASISTGSRAVTSLNGFQLSNVSAVLEDSTLVPAVVGTPTTSLPPATISGLSCSTNSLTVGKSTTCTVTVSPAQVTPTTISLSGSESQLAVPSSVTVAAGATRAQFSVTQNAAAPASATVTASLGSSTASTSLALAAPAPAAAPAVAPAILQGFTCSTGNLNPGGQMSCTLVLSGPAPAGGATVQLYSPYAPLSVPSNVTIPQGATSANLTISQASGSIGTGNGFLAVVIATYQQKVLSVSFE